jgi:hypothetical protein
MRHAEKNAFAGFLRTPPFQHGAPPSGGSREKWVCTTSEHEKTLTACRYDAAGMEPCVRR